MWSQKDFCSFIILLFRYVDVGCNGHVEQYKAPRNGDWQVGRAFLLGVHSCENGMVMQIVEMHSMKTAVHTLSLIQLELLQTVVCLSEMITN